MKTDNLQPQFAVQAMKNPLHGATFAASIASNRHASEQRHLADRSVPWQASHGLDVRRCEGQAVRSQ
jgi:hypothetical protein